MGFFHPNTRVFFTFASGWVSKVKQIEPQKTSAVKKKKRSKKITMLTPQSQRFVAFCIYGSLMISPTLLKNPQKVWDQEPQKYLWLITTTFTKTSLLWEDLRCHTSSRDALVINPALTWNFLLATKCCILLMTFTAVLCASVSLPRNTNTDISWGGRREEKCLNGRCWLQALKSTTVFYLYNAKLQRSKPWVHGCFVLLLWLPANCGSKYSKLISETMRAGVQR